MVGRDHGLQSLKRALHGEAYHPTHGACVAGGVVMAVERLLPSCPSATSRAMAGVWGCMVLASLLHVCLWVVCGAVRR